MNLRILFKSFKFAFRARKRVLSFIVVYAMLYIFVAKGEPLLGVPSYIMAFVVATVYAILIAQFRRRDIAILKCVSWSNSEIMLLLVGEVILVSVTAFLVVFQLSVEILGLMEYVVGIGPALQPIRDAIVIGLEPMAATLFTIIVLQIPGLILAQLRAMSIPPMKALREE
ncbi:MAG: hypothetical protein ACFFED_02795 [Candidatus Thorarchaeota archaeon]